MANEIQLIHDDGAETVYAIVRDMLGNWYHGTNPEAFDDANWGDYDIALAEVHACASGNVALQANFPAVAAGFYWLDVYVQAGASPAQTDFRTCSCLMYWSGVGGTLVPAAGAADARLINASAQAAANVKSVFLGTGHTDDVDLTARNFHVLSDTDHAVRFESTFANKDGLHCVGEANGQYNYGGATGQYNYGGEANGQYNYGVATGQYNQGGSAEGQYNSGSAYGQYNFGLIADVILNGTGTIVNVAGGNVVQIGAAAALAAYNTTGVAKEDSVGAISTILSGITSLAAWLRGLYRKDAINADALAEINAIHDGGAAGTYSATTDSNEAIADKTSGLTAQQTRDAMKLAPTDGTAATGSVDADLDAVKLKTDQIGSGRVTYASTVAEAALGTIWAGDDYRAADGTQFSITVEDYAGPSLATATAVLRIMDSVQYLSEDEDESVEADLEVAATIAIDGTTITLAADLTAAQTALLETAPPAAARNYIYEFVCTLANTHVGYRTHGQLTVRKAVSSS